MDIFERLVKAIIFVLFVLACGWLIFTVLISGSSQVSEGEVYQKEFRPAYTTTVWTPITTSNGENSTTVLFPFTYNYPDRWVVFIKAYNSEKDSWDTEDYYISQEVYDHISVGDYFVYDREFHLREEPHTKERKKQESDTQ